MTYTTASGVPIPDGPSAFNPPAQFKDWADADGAFNNVLNVNLDSERTALTAPKIRDGVLCWVRATKTLWSYQGTTWVPAIEDTGWITPTLGNSWTVFEGRTVKYRRKNGVVYLKGSATGGTSAALFTLPSGFRPAATVPDDEQFFSVMNGATTSGTTRIVVQPSGVVLPVTATQPHLEPVQFVADA